MSDTKERLMRIVSDYIVQHTSAELMNEHDYCMTDNDTINVEELVDAIMKELGQDYPRAVS